MCIRPGAAKHETVSPCRSIISASEMVDFPAFPTMALISPTKRFTRATIVAIRQALASIGIHV
jgi:hypothetical protein